MKVTGPVLAVALAGLVMTACGDGETIVCEFSGSASAVVGGGTSGTGFLELTSGAAMFIELGPQGLYMIKPAVRIQNMYPGKSGRQNHENDPLITFEVYLGTDLIGGSAHDHLGLTETAFGLEKLGVFTPFTADRAEYVGQVVTIDVEVEDACGRTASGSLDVDVQQ